jgi:putative DNA primase/helicase
VASIQFNYYLKIIMTTQESQPSNSYISDKHFKEFRDSAIDDVTANLNFWSFDGNDEGELDQVFSRLKLDPEHNNNGTLSGKSQQELANILRGGGWVFEGHLGIIVKLNNPRKDKDGKPIKYESGRGNQQIFVPHVSVRTSQEIAKKFDIKIRCPKDASPDDVNPHFWEDYLVFYHPLLVTEGAKKACSLISAGHPAIALNGVDGFGTNIPLLDKDGNKLYEKNPYGDGDRVVNQQDSDGNNLKTLQPELSEHTEHREIILAFDVDESPYTKQKVEAAKKRFRLAVEGIATKVTQIKWTEKDGKGVDDFIVKKGVEALNKAIGRRIEVKLPKPSKPEVKKDSTQDLRFASSIEGGLVQIEVIEGTEVPTRIGNHLQCVAYVDNPDQDGASLLLEFKTILNRVGRWTMPRGELAGDGTMLTSQLLDRGYEYVPKEKKALMEYLHGLGSQAEKTYTVVNRTGWVGHSFVLPHKTHGDESIRFLDVEPRRDTVTETKGILEDWRKYIGEPCAGNPIQIFFGIGIPLVAPLLTLLGRESGGFHLYGDTSNGKTTTMKIAASVAGVKKISTWLTTVKGLEAKAAASNDSVLFLDEMQQSPAEDVSKIIYNVHNGIGTLRMNVKMSSRKTLEWTVMVFSTGEFSSRDYLNANKIVQKGGQEVRLTDIPAVFDDALYGAFSTIHGYDDPRDFVKDLEHHCEQHRGVLMEAFLDRLVADRTDPDFDGKLSQRVNDIAKSLSKEYKNPAMSRVANKFALVQVALELAHSYDLLPFSFEDIPQSVEKIFKHWIEKRGGGDNSSEVIQACDRIKAMFVNDRFSDRVVNIICDKIGKLSFDTSGKGRNLLAYRKADKEGNLEEFWVPTKVFDKTLCQDANRRQLIAELQDRGWIKQPGANGRPTHERLASAEKTSYFIFLPEIFQDSEKSLSNTSNTSNASEAPAGKGVEKSNPFDTQENVMSNTSNAPDLCDDNADYEVPDVL